MQVWSLAWHRELRIQCYHTCGVGCNCSSDLISGSGTPYAAGRPKKKKKKERKLGSKICTLFPGLGAGGESSIKYSFFWLCLRHKFPGQGSNLNHGSNPNHSCDNAISSSSLLSHQGTLHKTQFLITFLGKTLSWQFIKWCGWNTSFSQTCLNNRWTGHSSTHSMEPAEVWKWTKVGNNT